MTNRPAGALQETWTRWMQQVEPRLPERARWIARIPAWGWGCAALLVILLAGRLAGLGAQPAAQAALPDTTLLAFDAIAKLGIVLGLFFVGIYAARRWRRFLPNQPQRKINVIETTRLSQRQALHLVRVGEQTLLIGATDQGLSLLTKVETPAAEAPAQPPHDFDTELALRQSLPASYFDFSVPVEPENR